MRAAERLNIIFQHLHKKSSLTISLNPCSVSQHLIHDKEFHFTLNSNKLSLEQRHFYENNGYLVIPKLVDDDIIDMCRNHFLNICNGDSPPQGIFLMKEPSRLKAGATGEHLYYKFQDILYDDVFSQYTASPKMLDYVQCFTGPNITAIHSMLINKPPDAVGTGVHPLHQDLLYFPFRPANLMVGTWTAMETVDLENGCLVVAPGSHRSGELLRHSNIYESGPYKTFVGVKDLQQMQTVPLFMEKGDTVFLHPLLIHGSGPNRSEKFRKAISCHYAASECSIIDIQNTVHTTVAKDFEATATRTKGVSFDYATIMKLRSVVVRGSEGFTAIS